MKKGSHPKLYQQNVQYSLLSLIYLMHETSSLFTFPDAVPPATPIKNGFDTESPVFLTLHTRFPPTLLSIVVYYKKHLSNYQTRGELTDFFLSA